MTITRDNCEAYLRFVARRIVEAGITTASVLLASPALRSMLVGAVAHWCAHIACRQHVVTEVGREVGMDADEMVSDFIGHVFRRGTHADKPWPTLTKLLGVMHQDGPDAVVPYLMKAVRYRALDLSRRHEVRMSRLGELRGFNQDDEYGVIDPGEARDDTSFTPDEIIVRRETIACFLSRMGESFVSDIVILADAVGLKRAAVAQLLFAGQQLALVTEVTQRLNRWLHDDYTQALRPLTEQARTYVLPARYKGDYDALLAYLYRQSSGAARSRLAERRLASGL